MTFWFSNFLKPHCIHNLLYFIHQVLTLCRGCYWLLIHMSEQSIQLLMCNVSINALPPSQSRILRLTLELRLKLELFVFCPVAHLALLSWTQQLDSQFPCGWKKAKNSWWKRNSPKCSRYQIIQTWQFFPCTTAPFFIPPRYCLLALLLCAYAVCLSVCPSVYPWGVFNWCTPDSLH